MDKIALLFAGQGAQVLGMGKDLLEADPTVETWFARANDSLGYKLDEICMNGPEEELKKTEHAQPAIFLIGWTAFQLLKQRIPQLQVTALAGLSLGEFTALTAGGACSFEEGLRLVRQRGLFMQAACEETRGAMAALVGMPENTVRALCAELEVEIANLNCPGQIVISGEADRIKEACAQAKSQGAKGAVQLKVAGAYHSRLMRGAQAKLRGEMADFSLLSPQTPVISNVTAQPHGSPAAIKDLLIRQVTSPVLWEATIRHLIDAGVTRFIELGPGSALSGFMKRINPKLPTHKVGTASSLNETVDALQQLDWQA